MKKVLHIRSGFTSGGTETLLLHLFNAPQRRFQVHLALLKDGSLIEELRPEGGNRYYRLFRKRFLDWAVIRQLIALVRREQIDVVHTHQFIELLYGLLLKVRYPKLEVVHHIHGMFPERDWTYRPERILSLRFAQVVTVSQAAKTELAERFGFDADKIAVVDNAVRLTTEERRTAAEARAAFTPPPDSERFNVVMVANFLWGKDHETVFKAYRDYIREQLPQVSLYFIGQENAQSRQLVEAYLEPEDLERGRVVLCGKKPNAKALLPAFDLFLMSSYSETFGLVILEAMLMQVPVLASDIPAFREISRNGQYCRHFKMGDAHDLFRQLRSLLAAPLAEDTASIAEQLQSRYSFDSFIDQLHALYEGKAFRQELALQG